MKHKRRLDKLEQETSAGRPVFKIERVAIDQARPSRVQRPAARPGEIRYIIENRPDESTQETD